MKRVLVTGATGFIGLEVSRQLTARGLKPRLMVRRPLRGVMLKHCAATLVQADLVRRRSLARAVAGIDTIIHLGARAAFEPYRSLYPSNVQGSLNLMQAAAAAGVKQVVYAGSLLVYADNPHGIDQTTEPAPLSDYGRVKREAEQRMQAMARSAGIRFASLRLSHVYGAHSLLFDHVRRGGILYPGRGDNRFAHLHVADAARALIQAAAIGFEGCAVIADEHSCTWNDVFATLQACQPRLRILHVPRPLAHVGAWVLDALFPLFGRANPYPSRAVSCWNLRLPVVPGTLQSVLGIRPRFPSIHEGIPAVMDEAVSFYWRPSNLDRV
jgi:nucleoside-diphosphate-sugar epimerase